MCRQVENEGRPDERRMPVGRDSGYLWRANTLSTYLQADDGVFVELETIGLSRRFPRGLGWITEPIARRLGRGSAAATLEEGRSTGEHDAPPVATPSFWCTQGAEAATINRETSALSRVAMDAPGVKA